MIQPRYYVWITDEDGNISMFEHRKRTSWTFKTAVRYAEEFIELHGAHCTHVIPVEA